MTETAILQLRLLRAKKLVARVVGHPVVGQTAAMLLQNRLPHRGCWIKTDSDCITAAVKASLLCGMYESAETRFVHQFLRADIDVIELGSSLGVVSSHIGKKLQPGRRLICVEANPRLLPLIEENVRTNAPNVRLKVIHAAISYDPHPRGMVSFICQADHTASAIKADGTDGGISVPALSLTEIVAQTGVGEYALVCDIEGAEAALIHDEEQVLRECRQLIIELHATRHAGRDVSVDNLLEWLESRHGFVMKNQYGPVVYFEREQ